jgi:hypothetical protein
MKTVVAWLKGIFRDPLFFRVCLVFWGGPFVALGLFMVTAVQIPPADAADWLLFALGAALGSYGAFLVFAGALGSNALVERATGFISEGGELLGLVLAVAVALVAVPVTVVLRALARRMGS